MTSAHREHAVTLFYQSETITHVILWTSPHHDIRQETFCDLVLSIWNKHKCNTSWTSSFHELKKSNMLWPCFINLKQTHMWHFETSSLHALGRQHIWWSFFITLKQTHTHVPHWTSSHRELGTHHQLRKTFFHKFSQDNWTFFLKMILTNRRIYENFEECNHRAESKFNYFNNSLKTLKDWKIFSRPYIC